MNARLLPNAPCECHPTRACPRTKIEMETTGTPCQDYSALNQNALKENGPHAKIMIMFARLCIEDDVAMVLHENTPFFKSLVLGKLLGGKYVHVPLGVLGPKLAGIDAFGRERQLDLFVSTNKLESLGDIKSTITWLSEKLREDHFSVVISCVNC